MAYLPPYARKRRESVISPELIATMAKPTPPGTPMREAVNVPTAWAIGISPLPTPMERHVPVESNPGLFGRMLGGKKRKMTTASQKRWGRVAESIRKDCNRQERDIRRTFQAQIRAVKQEQQGVLQRLYRQCGNRIDQARAGIRPDRAIDIQAQERRKEQQKAKEEQRLERKVRALELRFDRLRRQRRPRMAATRSGNWTDEKILDAINRGRVPEGVSDARIRAALQRRGRELANPRSGSAIPGREELKVLHLASQGFSPREIAQLLGKSERTVEEQEYRLRMKLGAYSRPEMVRHAQEWGYLKNPGELCIERLQRGNPSAAEQSEEFHGTPTDTVTVDGRKKVVLGELEAVEYSPPPNSQRHGFIWKHESGDYGTGRRFFAKQKPLLVADAKTDRPEILMRRSPMRFNDRLGLVG